MKKLIYSILTLFTCAVFFSACNTDFEAFPEPADGPMVLLDQVTTPVLDVTNIANASFAGVLRAPSANVKSITFNVALFRGNYNTPDSVSATSVTINAGENVNFEITSTEIANAITRLELFDADGVSQYDPNDASTFINITSPADLVAGDRIEVTAVVTDNNDVTHNIGDISQNLTNPGQRMAYAFTTFVSCPFVATDMAGTYSVTADPFGAGLSNATRKVTIEAGPGANQFTMKDIFGHFAFGTAPVDNNYDVVVDVNATTGEALVEQQDAWDPAVFGLSFTNGTVEGPGFAFSCTGTVQLGFTHRVSAGTYGGTWAYNLQKD